MDMTTSYYLLHINYFLWIVHMRFVMVKLTIRLCNVGGGGGGGSGGV